MNESLVFLTGVISSLLATFLFTALKVILNKRQSSFKLESKKGTIQIDTNNVEVAASIIVQNIEPPQIFLAYSGHDKEFVKRLAHDLQENGIRVWFAEQDINLGDKVAQKIERAIKKSAYYGVVLSDAFLKSKWLKKELSLMLQQESKQSARKILPILIEDVSIPEEIRDRVYSHSIYADFGSDYKSGLETLLRKLKGSLDKNVEQLIEANWLDLLEAGNEIRIKRHLTDLKMQIANSKEIFEIHENESTLRPTRSLRETIDLISVQLLALLEYDIKEYVPNLIELLAHGYNLILGPQPSYSVDYPKRLQADLWMAIMHRVYLIGAVALKLKKYNAVKSLIRVSPQVNKYWSDFYWARHALIMFARVNRGPNKKEGLVALTNALIPEIPWISDNFEVGSRDVIKYLGSFDLLQCMVAAHDAQEIKACYPSFGQFGNYHLNEILLDIVSKRGSYAIIEDIPDSKIASLLVQLDDYASKEYAFYAGWRPGSFPDEVKNFIRRNQE